MEQNQKFADLGTKITGKPAGKEQSRDVQRHGVLAEHWYSLERSSREIWPLAKRIQSISCMDKSRRMGERSGAVDPAGYCRRNNLNAGQHQHEGASTCQQL